MIDDKSPVPFARCSKSRMSSHILWIIWIQSNHNVTGWMFSWFVYFSKRETFLHGITYYASMVSICMRTTQRMFGSWFKQGCQAHHEMEAWTPFQYANHLFRHKVPDINMNMRRPWDRLILIVFPVLQWYLLIWYMEKGGHLKAVLINTFSNIKYICYPHDAPSFVYGSQVGNRYVVK